MNYIGLDMYEFIDNTFILQAKTDPMATIEIEVGDIKQPDFYPQVKIKRWENEVNFSARLIHDADEASFTEKDGKIKWQNKEIKADFYNIESCEEHPEGGYEFEIILEDKPKSNKIEFSIRPKGLDFFYQPELTQEEKDAGAYQPENVIGSYAVYYKECPPNYVGKKLYRAGKFCHIYRPRIEDAIGNWTWGILNIDVDKEVLSVTIDQNFLDNAVYPVRHAAGLTFGLLTKGAVSMWLINASFAASWAEGAVGTAQSIKAYLENQVSSSEVKMGLYIKTGTKTGTYVIGSGTDAWIIPSWDNWKELECLSPPTVSAIDYWICVKSTDDFRIYYDTAEAGKTALTQGYSSYDTWEPINLAQSYNRIFSIYCIYSSFQAAWAARNSYILGQGIYVS